MGHPTVLTPSPPGRAVAAVAVPMTGAVGLLRPGLSRLLVLAMIAAIVAPSARATAQPDPPIVINEFVASNQNGLLDNAGETSDWIELHNTSGAPVDLAGWSIADGDTSFTFASQVLDPNEYVVVFASGEVGRSTPTELHLPFKLDADGEALALTDPTATLSQPAWPAGYPAQVSDISYGLGSGGGLFFFDPPTPGAGNGGGLAGVVEPVGFSVPAGFHTTAQQVALETPTSSATIRYTTDGSTPSATNGTAIAPGSSITVDQTSVVRAIALRDGWVNSPVDTRTYLFTADIVQQDASPPPGWPADSAVNGQDMDYGMDPNVVAGNEAVIANALQAIPTISIVTDLDNLFDADSGIYVNARERGRDWERPASIELIDPSGAEAGFDINGGLRIRGGFSRNPNNPKHSFRLFFRNEYEGDLPYALFGAEGVADYEKVDLRTAQNYAWSWVHSDDASFIDEVWSRDTQVAMGQPSTRSRQYHLYLNGTYWGLYMTQERVSGDYGERYFGGDDADYDVVKRAAPDSTTEATDGDLVAWNSLYPLVSDGAVTAVEYDQIAAAVDLENLADYYLLHFFTGDYDGAPSWYFQFSGNRWTSANNWYALRNRTGIGAAGTWQFFDHDSEHSLCAPEGPELDENVDNTTPWPLRSGVEYLSPANLHQALLSDARYRQLFADRVQLHLLTPGGALTVAAAEARLDARVAEVSGAIEAESARWGDGPSSSSAVFGRSEWEGAVARLRTCFTQRQAIVQAQLSADGLWPAGVPPTLAPPPGSYAFGTTVALDAGGQPGTIWYTTDGSDPRGADGSPSVTAASYGVPIAVAEGLIVRARILDGTTWTPIVEGAYTLTGPVGPIRLVLNEYNAVEAGSYLGGGTAGDIANGSDVTLGRIDGNGGDWFELLVVEDHLDVRGWSVEVLHDPGGGHVRTALLTFADEPVLSDLRAGTLITISEQLADDVSYFPPAGDWHLNLQANDAGDGAFVTAASQSDFVIDHQDTQIALFDELGRPATLRTGEGTAPEAGVNSTEVFRLAVAPTPAITPASPDYDDDTGSSWGRPNPLQGGAAGTQNLTSLRVDFGDASCDGTTNIVDALYIAQREVGIRNGTTCPEFDLEAADVNGDGTTNIVDALFIAQCEVGRQNVFCPD